MHIALLEDDFALASEVQHLLSEAGHVVAHFANGQNIMRALMQAKFDLFVLDWHVPAPNGMDVLRYLRGGLKLAAPVVFLTSNTQEEQLAQALLAGADDYCTKPLRPIEFLARVCAIERRMTPHDLVANDGELLPGYVFNSIEKTVCVGADVVKLTEKEFQLARLLFENFERPISREYIMRSIWGRQEDALSRTLDVHTSWIRKKLRLGADAQLVRLMVVHGFGYRLTAVHLAEGVTV